METICILCKHPIKKINDEHIIPKALLGDPSKTENTLISNDICIDCNKNTGKEVDSEFINNHEIIALRLLHKDFLNKDTNPKLKLSNIINVKIDGHEIPCDLFIDKNGQKIYPTKKPIENDNTKIFYIHEKEIDNFIKKMENKDDVIINKSNYKFQIIGSLDLSSIIHNKFQTSNFIAPFSRLLFKMIIEYISFKFGQNIALHEKFDPIRELALKKRDNYDTKYQLKFYNNYPYNIDQKEFIDHNIGIKFENEINEWVFFFNFYGLIEYNFVIPFDSSYKNTNDCIRIYK